MWGRHQCLMLCRSDCSVLSCSSEWICGVAHFFLQGQRHISINVNENTLTLLDCTEAHAMWEDKQLTCSFNIVLRGWVGPVCESLLATEMMVFNWAECKWTAAVECAQNFWTHVFLFKCFGCAYWLVHLPVRMLLYLVKMCNFIVLYCWM